jgi:hypothetical protein
MVHILILSDRTTEIEIEIAFKTTFNPLIETIVNSNHSFVKQFYRKQDNSQHLFT